MASPRAAAGELAPAERDLAHVAQVPRDARRCHRVYHSGGVLTAPVAQTFEAAKFKRQQASKRQDYDNERDGLATATAALGDVYACAPFPCPSPSGSRTQPPCGYHGIGSSAAEVWNARRKQMRVEEAKTAYKRAVKAAPERTELLLRAGGLLTVPDRARRRP